MEGASGYSELVTKQIAKCQLLTDAAARLGNINMKIIIRPGDAPAVRTGVIADFEICSDGMHDTYDVWSINGRQRMLEAGISLDAAALLLVRSYTKKKRQMMQQQLMQYLRGTELESRLDQYFDEQHNGYRGRE